MTLWHFQLCCLLSLWHAPVFDVACCQVETHPGPCWMHLTSTIRGIPANWKRWVIPWRRASRCNSKSLRQNGCLGGKRNAWFWCLSRKWLKFSVVTCQWMFFEIDQHLGHLGTFQSVQSLGLLWPTDSANRWHHRSRSTTLWWEPGHWCFFMVFPLRLWIISHWMVENGWNQINIKVRLKTHLERPFPFLGKTQGFLGPLRKGLLRLAEKNALRPTAGLIWDRCWSATPSASWSRPTKRPSFSTCVSGWLGVFGPFFP